MFEIHFCDVSGSVLRRLPLAASLLETVGGELQLVKGAYQQLTEITKFVWPGNIAKILQTGSGPDFRLVAAPDGVNYVEIHLPPGADGVSVPASMGTWISNQTPFTFFGASEDLWYQQLPVWLAQQGPLVVGEPDYTKVPQDSGGEGGEGGGESGSNGGLLPFRRPKKRKKKWF